MEGSEIVLCDIRANTHYYTCQNPQNSQHQVNSNVNYELSSPLINVGSSLVRRAHHTSARHQCWGVGAEGIYGNSLLSAHFFSVNLKLFKD